MFHRLKSVGRLVLYGGYFYCCGHCVTQYVAEVTFLSGPSMQPTLNEKQNNVVLVEHISRNTGKLKKGDVIISKSPVHGKSLVCKRIAGMEGDRVIRPEGMFNSSASKHLRVPPGHVWLLGDNPEDSTDSRNYGAVPLGLITGRVCFKLYPLSEFGRFP